MTRRIAKLELWGGSKVGHVEPFSGTQTLSALLGEAPLLRQLIIAVRWMPP